MCGDKYVTSRVRVEGSPPVTVVKPVLCIYSSMETKGKIPQVSLARIFNQTTKIVVQTENIKKIHAGDISWPGPARPGETRSFRINPPEFVSRAEAPYSGRLRYYST
ncbi:hypothetical protein J6590_065512 [Homalodisca vitripennis]|nr:hypothetical protein J6590_065512 [Homalodisca vitripennis]